ncbi:MAG: iron-containing alcohol dehydrogenase [Caldimicrobium sp.]
MQGLFPMKDFEFYFPTKIVFGKNVLKKLEEDLPNYGKKVLLIYGKASLIKSGFYEKLHTFFSKKGLFCIEFGGIKPNPPLGQVLAGIEVARKEKPDFLLAVGGGSVIDAAKAIACGYYYGEAIWDFFERKGFPDKALPVITLPTIAGTGSEANDVSVIVNEKKGLKLSLRSPMLFPKAAYLDPTLTMTVPKNYTFYGIMDAFSHLFEFFHFRLDKDSGFPEDYIILLMKTLLKAGYKLLENPNDYAARSEIMWVSTLALSPVVRAGLGAYRFFLHSLEHPLSGLFDTPHGLGLSILMRAYLKRFATHSIVRNFFQKVFEIPEESNLSKKGLKYFDKLLDEFEIPKTLKALDIPKDSLPQLIEKACEILYIWKAEKEFSPHIVKEIYELAYDN